MRSLQNDPADDTDITEDATLELEDGRKGDILLRRVVALSGYGEFRGTGPPPS